MFISIFIAWIKVAVIDFFKEVSEAFQKCVLYYFSSSLAMAALLVGICYNGILQVPYMPNDLEDRIDKAIKLMSWIF